MATIRKATQTLFKRHLFITNITISGTLFGLGDILQQSNEIHIKREKSAIDWARTARMAATGMFVMGPLSHHWFRYIDKRWPGRDFLTVGKKVASDQLVSGPPFQFAFFLSMGTMEGDTVKEICHEFRHKFAYVFMADCAIWVPVQCLNFYFVPPQFRILFISCIFVFWNTFLSYFKHQEIPVKVPLAIKAPLQNVA